MITNYGCRTRSRRSSSGRNWVISLLVVSTSVWTRTARVVWSMTASRCTGAAPRRPLPRRALPSTATARRHARVGGGGRVAGDRHTRGRGPRLVQRQARRDASVREEAPAGADDHREHQQVEASTRSLSSRNRTSVPLPCTWSSRPSRFLSSQTAEARSPSSTVVLAHCGVLEHGRGDVLGQRVEAVRHRVVRIGRVRSGGGEDVVRAPAEEKRVHLAEHLVDELAGRLVEVGTSQPPRSKPSRRSSSGPPGPW
jgi:hypothetical protein